MKNNKLKVETVIPWKLDYNTVCTRIIKKNNKQKHSIKEEKQKLKIKAMQEVPSHK